MMPSSALQRTMASDAYTDLAGLNSIRDLARTDKNAALEEVAKQFESMLVRMMMKSMRDANAVFAKGNMLSSPSSDMYQQMYDDQLAVSLSKGSGMGIGEMMVKQLQQKFGVDRAEAKQKEQAINRDIEAMAVQPVILDKDQKTDVTAPLQAAALSKEAVSFNGSVHDFVSKIYGMAKSAAEKLNVSPKTLISQAALETGWGKKITQSASGESSLNLFNIKAGKGWQGGSVSVSTLEFKNDLPVREQADFRSYQTIQQSFDDYVDFIVGKGRYQKALSADSDEQYIKELASAGYATDPNYAEKIIGILNSDHFNNALAQVEIK